MATLALLFLAIGVSSGASAQAISEPLRGAEIVSDASQLDAKREGSARFFDPEDGQFDLSYFLENPRGFLPIPIVVTEPAVGYGGGVAGMFLRPRREAGDEGWARPDISAVGAFATAERDVGRIRRRCQPLARWTTAHAGRCGHRTVQSRFLRSRSRPIVPRPGVRYSLQFSGGVAQANWQLAPKSPWAVGLRYVYADVDPKLRDDPLFPGLADRVRVKISAPTAIVEFDTRDNVFTPTHGIYAESSYLASREALGASDDFERFQQVLIGWQPLPHDVTLGARANYAWSSDGTPFFLRPFVQLRGVPAMRYQGDQAASVELEARWQFLGRWSAVVFGGAGTTRTERDAFAATQNVGSGGVGFRYELASKFGMHAGIDVAHSPGTTAVYFVVGNAWFRP